ncbi:hypothetical protein [Methylocucumis oryzae]|uniref:Uncharacterized protein n=1 Tax=Methylocucumis oryzae TaxID=1632867 RepID=A0A0F3IH45_9GAMM|nr:hypothetical protein [Methylocucumis oryzae]KJV05868.1 hypothetical protein VZ94_15070 [Methylocucumis oryzae]
MKIPDINILAILGKTKLKAFMLWLRRIPLAEFNNNRLAKPAPIACGILLMALSGQVLASTWFDPKTNTWYFRFKDAKGKIQDIPVDYLDRTGGLVLSSFGIGPSGPKLSTKLDQETKTSPLPQIPNSVYHNAYQIDTESFTTDVGEPLVTGMTRTFGRFYKATRNERVVLNTYGSTRFGSDLDTIIAVYRIDFSGGATGADALKTRRGQ